jgi:hypothetical protein
MRDVGIDGDRVQMAERLLWLAVLGENLALALRERERVGLRNISAHKDFVRRGDLPARARGRYAA